MIILVGIPHLGCRPSTRGARHRALQTIFCLEDEKGRYTFRQQIGDVTLFARERSFVELRRLALGLPRNRRQIHAAKRAKTVLDGVGQVHRQLVLCGERGSQNPVSGSFVDMIFISYLNWILRLPNQSLGGPAVDG